MNSSKIKQEIDELNARLEELKKQEVAENFQRLVPFIREHGVCEYYELAKIYVSIKDPEKEKEFVNLFGSASESNGYHHFGVELSEFTTLRFDDGEISFCFRLSGSPIKMMETIKNEMSKLKLSIDFSRAIKQKTAEVENKQKALNDLLELKRLFS